MQATSSRQRRRRRAALRARGRRGVSPIIATILLVAITVVLAAVLYVFLIPLIGHSTTPLNGNLSWGNIVCYGPGSGCSTGPPSQPGCPQGDLCWAAPVVVPSGGGVSPSALNLYVQNTQSQTVSSADWNFSFVYTTNPPRVFAYAPGSIAGSSGIGWTPGSGYSTGDVLTDTMILWIDTGSDTAYSGPALSLIASGANGYSGSFSTSLPT